MSLRIVPADTIDFADFTRTLNRAYHDYYVPIDMTVTRLRGVVAEDDIDLSASRVALDGDAVIGLGMLAHRGALCWIGGLGMIPGRRGEGIGRHLMHSLLDAARTLNLKTVQLEVITQNTAAHKLYLSLGFTEKRLLHIMEGRTDHKPDSDTYRFQKVAGVDVLPFYPRFHPVPNPWQRDYPLLQKIAPNLSAFITVDNSGVLAYALGVFQAATIRYVDLAHAPGQAAALKALVAYLHQQYPLANGSIINVGEDDPAWAVLAAMSYTSVLSQHEMTLKLG